MSCKDSFETWLTDQIMSILERDVQNHPLLICCDPDREWLELLRTASTPDVFELWAEPEEHELVLRERFYNTERKPRVVWLPCSREDISWFKVFELEAESVWEKNLLEALRDYGVNIPRETEEELISILPAHAREWFGKSKDTWKELTPGTAKGTLIDDRRMLQVLAGDEGEFDKLKKEDKFSIFIRRSVEDFNLPSPENIDEKSWRISSLAKLICTEAAKNNPQEPPGEREKIIPPGLCRDRALKLLKDWQENINYIPTFEQLVPEADKTIGLNYWAKNLAFMPESYSSRLVEETLFRQEVDKLDRIDEVYRITREMDKNLNIYINRENKFWEKDAANKIGWSHLVRLAEAASLLIENEKVEKNWKNSMDSVNWYQTRGWQLDLAGENLFEESRNMPPELHRIRARLRRGYLRTVDKLGRAFSQFMAYDSSEVMKLPTAGEITLKRINEVKVPTALIFLDAFRLDLGYRLAELINHGESVKRADVSIAIAPIPSITPLGMAFALPVERGKIKVNLSSGEKNFTINADEFQGDLKIAEERRKWLSNKFEVKEFLDINEVIDSDKLKKTGRSRKIIAVYGTELDKEGHDGQLQLKGATDNLERYAQAIRCLRKAGYSRVIIITDHGFFHWQPEEDEIEEEKPGGDILWLSRRAIVGTNLSHSNAIKLPVPGSTLEAMVPRSINAFKTYGKLGFFHGGATLQELIIPVITIDWPEKARKINVVLKPVGNITSEAPRVQVEAAETGQQTMFGFDASLLSRSIFVKIKELATGKVVFKHKDSVTIEQGKEPLTVQLQIIEPKPELSRGIPLVIEVIDGDDEEVLTREDVTLKIDIEDW